MSNFNSCPHCKHMALYHCICLRVDGIKASHAYTEFQQALSRKWREMADKHEADDKRLGFSIANFPPPDMGPQRCIGCQRLLITTEHGKRVCNWRRCPSNRPKAHAEDSLPPFKLQWIEDGTSAVVAITEHGDLTFKPTPKEPPMTSEQMLALQPYNSTSKCPKCGTTSSYDYYVNADPDRSPAPIRLMRRSCGGRTHDEERMSGCGHVRYELPNDWNIGDNEGEADNLTEWCFALEQKEAAEATLKRLSEATK